MIQLVFLASIREQLGCDAQAFELPQPELRVAELIELLSEQSETWRQALQGEQLLIAVNQQMSRLDASVRDGDEVAFFPPVTGG